MENMRDVANYIGQGTYIPATEEEFPYYFVKAPGASNMVLHVGDTDLSLVKASNRTNQRFKVHSEEYQGITNRNRDTLDIKIKLDQESINTIIDKTAKNIINKGEIAFWVEGASIAIGFGPTPISKGNEIRLITNVNIIGKTAENLSALSMVNSGEIVIVEQV